MYALTFKEKLLTFRFTVFTFSDKLNTTLYDVRTGNGSRRRSRGFYIRRFCYFHGMLVFGKCVDLNKQKAKCRVK